ncbi:MAG: hypothetical protein ACRELD_06945 [Longimicrobiales bacterium]
MTNQSMLADLAKGAVAGAVATWAMGQVNGLLHERTARGVRRRERRARAGMPATRAVHAGEAIVGRGLDRAAQQQLAGALRWGSGIAAGAVYGALRRRFPGVRRARGLGFGAGFFAVADETLAPFLDLAPTPFELPWQTHVRGLSGHLVFGAVADGVLELLDRVT